MKEKIYTIPVNDAFDKDCECPLCAMYQELENNAVEYTMGPSYMEDDIRAETDKMGFCRKHLKKIYAVENRLGFALVMKTHMDKGIKEIERRCLKRQKHRQHVIILKNWNSPALCVTVYKIHLSGMWIRCCIYISPMQHLKRNTCTARVFVQRITAC